MLRAIFICLFLTSPLTSNAAIINHDEILAKNLAADFLEIVFIKKTPKAGYKYLHPAFQKEFPQEAFIENFSNAATVADISRIEAVSFELLNEPGQLAIYLSATNTKGTGYFKIVMYGDGKEYKILRIKTIDALPKLDHPMSGTFQEAKVVIRRGVWNPKK